MLTICDKYFNQGPRYTLYNLHATALQLLSIFVRISVRYDIICDKVISVENPCYIVFSKVSALFVCVTYDVHFAEDGLGIAA